MASFTQLDWYDTPRYYDAIFDIETKDEADFLEAVHERFGSTRGKRALEPACGSGRLVHELAQRGWRVTGIDLSQPMLDFAAERLLNAGFAADLRQADMSDFRTRARFDFAHCLVSTFKYLLTEDQARGHLECVARALKPGGIYVLGFHLSDYEEERKLRERWVVKRGRETIVCNTQTWPADRRTRIERVRTRLAVQSPGATELRTETHWEFRSYDARQTRRLLRSVPELEHVATYDFSYDLDQKRDLDDDQFDTVLVLRRRD